MRSIDLSCFKGAVATAPGDGIEMSGSLLKFNVSKNESGKYGVSVEGGYESDLGGIFISAIEFPESNTGIEVHDRILEVNGKSMLTAGIKDFTRIILEEDSFDATVFRIDAKFEKSHTLARPPA